MKTLCSCILSLIYINLIQAQIPQGDTWFGDYTISNQVEADAFIEQCQCNAISGDLLINGYDIVHLDSLYVLKEVQGSVEIKNTSLQNCYGLTKITTLGKEFKICHNDNLTQLNQFVNLQSIGGDFDIFENHRLVEISGFGSLENVDGSITVFYNDSLEVLNGFNQLKHLVYLIVGYNNFIHKIEGFNSLVSIKKLKISNNDLLQKISGFNKVKIVSDALNIESNEELQSLVGFSNLCSVVNFSSTEPNTFSIVNNSKISRIDGFDLLKEVNGNCALDFNTLNNATQLFNNLQIVTGSLYTNFTHFQKLDSVGNLTIQTNLDTLLGFPKLKKARKIYITNTTLKHMINPFPVLESVNNIYINNNDSLLSISGFQKLNEIDGSLSIGSNLSLSSIQAFNQLKTINGNLELRENSRLTIIEGFDSLNWITRALYITRNNSLKEIRGFQQLENVYDIFVNGNNNLVTIHEFEQLQSLGRIFIENNLRLKTIPKFNQLTDLYELDISANLALEEVMGFSNIPVINSIRITSNTNLNRITGFDNLKTIQFTVNLANNTNLLSVDAFNQLIHVRFLNLSNRNLRILNAFTNLKSVDELELSENIQLRSIDNFSNLRVIKEVLRLSGNLQLNDCCLVNCWINESVIDEDKLIIDRNGMHCIDLPSINEHCQSNTCQQKEESISDLHIVENPVAENFQFNFISYNAEPVEYMVCNLQNQVVAKERIIPELGYNLKGADLTGIERGFYFLVLQKGSTKIVTKFVKY